MNQQRGRRYLSAKEKKEKLAKSNQNPSPSKEVDPLVLGPEFDSNVITPGTPFMSKVRDVLQAYIKSRLSDWGNIAVILSDSNHPGEGEVPTFLLTLS
jgi:5'-3' exoribonuclease 2